MITVCPNDEELLAVASGDTASSELQSHLRECSRCIRKVGGFQRDVRELQRAYGSFEAAGDSAEELEGQGGKGPPTISVLGTIPLDSGPMPVTDQPARIGKYLVMGTLGSGGQGTVYKAIHPTLEDHVVIKLSSQALSGDDAGRSNRLLAEGRLLGQLKHANIGRVYDLDLHEGRPYLVMEYVAGRTLDQYARDRKLSPTEIATIGAKLARALSAAHRLGVVHQDVKPQNIIIDQHDEPRLIDFGMARLSSAWSAESGQPVGGTLQYMPPEQARGKTDSISGKSDIFALGSVLYFLITGRAPFKGESRQDTLKLAASANFDVEALRSARMPAGLKQIARRAMAADPADRYATADDMAAALEGFRRGAKIKWILMRVGLPVVIGLCVGLGWLMMRPPQFPPGGQFIVTPDRHAGLDGNLPLVTGTGLKIDAKVPRNYPSVIFWIGAGGTVSRMPVTQVRDADAFDDVYSPSPDKVTVLSGKAGTEFFLVISGPGLDDPKNVDALEGELKAFFSTHTLSDLPPTGVVLMGSDGTQVRFLDGGETPRDPGAEKPDSCADVSKALDELIQHLKNRGFFFTGIAVPHQDAQQQ